MRDEEWVKWGVLGLAAVGFLAVVVIALNFSSSGDLEGPTWHVESLVVDGETASAVPDTTVTATFDDGGVGGSGGCNSYAGSYATDGETIEFGPIASTLMACEGPIGHQEQAFFAALGAADSFDVSDGTLTLSQGDVVLVTFEESRDG